MKIVPRRLDGTFDLLGTVHDDHRGFLLRTYERESLREHDLDWTIEQESLSHTAKANTLRGLHFQLPPCSEGKIITAIRGAMRWIVVDLRSDSPTFREYDTVVLSGSSPSALAVQPGFAHGCLSVSDDCDLIIKSNQKFGSSPGAGIHYADPVLAIDWGLGANVPIMSDRDRSYPSFEHFLRDHGGALSRSSHRTK